MKHIGIVGVTAEGCALCYRLIVAMATEWFGLPKHPEISIHNFSFYDYHQSGPTEIEKWRLVHDKLLISIEKLKMLGADFVIIPANTVHHDFEYVETRSVLPILNIVDVAIDECEKLSSKNVGVLGTNFIMNNNLYKCKLMNRGMIQVLPDANDAHRINILINDLISGKSDKKHKMMLSEIINKINCDTIILACTELSYIISDDINIPIIDTTKILAKAAFKRAIS